MREDGWVKGVTRWHVFTVAGLIPCNTAVPMSSEVWSFLPDGALICSRCKVYLTRRIVEET